MKYLLLVVFTILAGCAKKPIIKEPVIDPNRDIIEDIINQPPKIEEEPIVKAIEFPTIYFEFDSYAVKDKVAIKEVADHLIKTGESVLIEGHACKIGPEEYNMFLSNQRAIEVKMELVLAGVDRKKLTSVGFGEDKPTSDVNAENRRVEFKLLTGGKKE